MLTFRGFGAARKRAHESRAINGIGTLGEIRTPDLRVRSALLYPLSYEGKNYRLRRHHDFAVREAHSKAKDPNVTGIVTGASNMEIQVGLRGWGTIAATPPAEERRPGPPKN